MSEIQISSESNGLSISLGQVFSPDEAEVVIVSTDKWGNSGQLNSYVLKTLGYDAKFMPNELELSKGYHLLDQQKKPILFIVTVSV